MTCDGCASSTVLTPTVQLKTRPGYWVKELVGSPGPCRAVEAAGPTERATGRGTRGSLAVLPPPPRVPRSEENTPLDLDDHGGRTFLRVLLHLTMHDYPPLVSGALQLLFRHFSQRQEVLQAFKQVVRALCVYMCVRVHTGSGVCHSRATLLQVQLLVTSQDVDNYKQIKQDLDQLRSIVEKSELWVYKGQGPDEALDGVSGENEHKKAEVGEARVRPGVVHGPLETSHPPPLGLGGSARCGLGCVLTGAAP